MPDSPLIGEAELMACTGIQRRSALKRELTRLGVRYFASRHSVWTTTAALEAALGLRTDPPAGRRITIGHGQTSEMKQF